MVARAPAPPGGRWRRRHRWRWGCAAGGALGLGLLAALVVMEFGPITVLVRTTPQLQGVARWLPRPPTLRRRVGPTAGDPAESGALWVPVGQPRPPGVLLVNGVGVEGGWRNPVIGGVARDIAQVGFAVYVPNLPGLQRGVVGADTVRALEADLLWLAHSRQVAAPRVAMIGICVGGSLALLAAEAPSAAGRRWDGRPGPCSARRAGWWPGTGGPRAPARRSDPAGRRPGRG